MSEKNLKSRRKLLLGVGGAAALGVWHKPIINSVVMPAHAQTSMLPTCPMIVIGNVLTGPVSGNNAPPVCSVTFDVLSSDATTPLTVTSITTGTLPADTTVTNSGLGAATNLTGPRVVWRGPATNAPFCMPFTPIDNVVFTITATCAAPGSLPVTQTFNLTDILT